MTTKADLKTMRCSFCGKNAEEVEKLIAGPGVYICGECVTLCVEWLESDSPAPPRAPYLRASPDAAAMAGKPSDEVLELIASRSGAAKGADQNVKELVAFVRARGVSWTRIGEALGVTRQAAWERYSDEK